MKQTLLWRDSETFILSSLEFYNWGGFQGYHRAEIDSSGTAVIGPTGSGKTTLVDALMTLLCANPRYNLASTGGHESDRDLVSYVRGVSGPGDGGAEQSHIARQGKTVTAIAATLERDGAKVRIGAVLWFESTSSSASDLKKLWLLAESPEQTIEHWLSQHHAGGMRALRHMEKEGTGVWPFPSKRMFLARLREYFEVGENAFTLLNRAAGLKQLNSIDEIFRELVLDDRAAFERAEEVVRSFDDLTDIHRELETARKQHRSLLPIADGWQRYKVLQEQFNDKQALESILPVWFAEQGHRLWLAESQRLEQAQKHAEGERDQCQSDVDGQRSRVDQHRQRYLQVGGAGIDQLRQRIEEWNRVCERRGRQAEQYCRLANRLSLPDELTASVFEANRQQIRQRLDALALQLESAREKAFQAGVTEKDLDEKLKILQQERADVERRPGSNIGGQFHAFRNELAQELGLDESALPFVAELVQVKPEEQVWRGAIERAIGSHRLRIVVPPESAQSALRWVNQRHNRLHVRLLELKDPVSRPVFLQDGFTRKLLFKEHVYREAVKALLADNDRHCVAGPEDLRSMPHAMTAQGLMSGKERYFDKQDQKRLEDDWLTGFDNRDRLAFLAEQLHGVSEQLKPARLALAAARDQVQELEDSALLLKRIEELHFDDIDLPSAEAKLQSLSAQLETLTRPDSNLAIVKAELDEAEAFLKRLEDQLRQHLLDCAALETKFDQAASAARRAFHRAEKGLGDRQRELAQAYFPTLTAENLGEMFDLEREHLRVLRDQLKVLGDKLGAQQVELANRMSDALKVDTGALTEVGRELADIPRYLERLRVLTEEALPEKLKRFLEYLNRSSDDGVTQLLSYIDHEVSVIEERLEDLNNTMRRVDFQPGRYLRLVANKVIHESLRTLQRAQRQLASARFNEDEGESHFKALQELVTLLKEACDHSRNLGPKALLDPRFRLEFAVSVINRETAEVIETRTGSQGGSGGEKEIIASYVLTASLSYALCPDGSSRPLFGTIVLDEAFSRSSHAVAGRIIAALKEFGLHAVFITPNKEMRLLRHHTRSAVVVHRRGVESSVVSLSWEALDEHYQQRMKATHEITD
ncbi:ATP-binding protein [Pseudomonas kermanshahensis]|uniref:ATP-binding protein n=1 Tax=Pseudomonas kermanshahensis TaxID=2745482 RepID=UPI0023DBEB29|nr:ATP-binding protein [Pseudomonas kermanshahensis]WEL53634.1 ATP-binding protein [Pseudomonas kermanshahensis]